MVEAAIRYCDKMGAVLDNHQIVVYQHHDQPHKHIHIYINRVPVNGSPALVTSHNYARNVRACKEISEELSFAKLERLEEGQLRHVTLDQLEAQKAVHLAIKEALKGRANSPEKIERRLKEKGIECRFTLEEGKLKYSSYCYQGVPIKGQDVGFTARQLQARLDKNLLKKEAEKVIPQESFGKRRIRW